MEMAKACPRMQDMAIRPLRIVSLFGSTTVLHRRHARKRDSELLADLAHCDAVHGSTRIKSSDSW